MGLLVSTGTTSSMWPGGGECAVLPRKLWDSVLVTHGRNSGGCPAAPGVPTCLRQQPAVVGRVVAQF